METEETYSTPTPEANNIVLTPEAQSYLLQAGKWANFLAIIGFIFCGLFLILALSIGSIFSALSQAATYNPAFAMLGGMGAAATIFYLLIDVLYFFFSLYLYQFASKIKAGINFRDSAHVTTGLEKLKSFFKLWGILTIVIIVVYALSIIGVAIFAANTASHLHQ